LSANHQKMQAQFNRFSLIIGAPKCGTSSLYSWLCSHPSICGTSPKETFAFVDRDSPLFSKRILQDDEDANPASTLNRLASKKHGAEVLLEATTHHLYQETAINAAIELNDPRVFLLLRKPSSRILSSFLYTKNNLARINPVFSFDEYVRALLDGKEEIIDEAVLSPISAYVLKNELRISDYNSHIVKWTDALGGSSKNLVKVIVSEEMFENPQSSYCEALKHMCLSSEGLNVSPFKKQNETRRIGSRWLQLAARHAGGVLPDGICRSVLKGSLFRIQKFLSNGRKETYLWGLKELDEYFNESNDKLFCTLGREITAWRSKKKAS